MRISMKTKLIMFALIIVLIGIYIYLGFEGFSSFDDREQDGTMCPPGFWCPASNKVFPCPGGTYGDEPGLKTPVCSGPCAAGSMCPEASTTDSERPCPAGYFCVEGTGGQTSPPVICPAGFYCPSGSEEPTPCEPNVACPEGTVSVPEGE